METGIVDKVAKTARRSLAIDTVKTPSARSTCVEEMTVRGGVTMAAGAVTTVPGEVMTVRGEVTTAPGVVTTAPGEVTTAAANCSQHRATAVRR